MMFILQWTSTCVTLNNTTCDDSGFRKEKEFIEKRWKDVHVGDFVRVIGNEIVPADLLLLHTSDPKGVCLIETANLDGETNLKQRRVVSGLCITVGKIYSIFFFTVSASSLFLHCLTLFWVTLKRTTSKPMACPDTYCTVIACHCYISKSVMTDSHVGWNTTNDMK